MARKAALAVIMALVVGVTVYVYTTQAGESDGTRIPADVEKPEPTVTMPVVEDDGDPNIDDGWFMESYALAPDALGNFSGDSRLVNQTGHAVEAAEFTATVLDDKEIVAVLEGLASDVAAGETITVQWTSDDAFVDRKASHTVELQVEYAY